MFTCWKVDGDSNDDSEQSWGTKVCFSLIRPSFQTRRLRQTKSVRGVEEKVERLLLTNVCFGRQVEDHVDVFCVEDVIDQPRVAHISLLEEGNSNSWRLYAYEHM